MTTASPHGASLVLVRHGRTTWVEEGRFQGSSDVPLSAHGRAQAAAVGACLADPRLATRLPVPGGPPVVIRHSPLTRAADTAGAIAAARGEDDRLAPDEDLREIAQGAWEGLRHLEVRAGWPTELASWREDPLHHHAPGGESLQSASERAGRVVARMLADVGARLEAAATERDAPVPGPRQTDPPSPGSTPDVAHQDPWSITVAHDGILRLVLLRLLDLPLERYRSFPFALCAISVVEVRDGRARLRAHNLEEHLAGVESADEPVDGTRAPGARTS